jgi:5'-nucleotidase
VALILLTNDDGIEAEGLQLLRIALTDLAEILVVAPDRERSAVSHGLTIHSPLTLRQHADRQFTIDGTPADCIIYALGEVTGRMPDLVVSGINRGANLGDDIMYSGTVAGAREASRRGIPAVAISQAYVKSPVSFRRAVRFAKALVKSLLGRTLSAPMCLNVNIPDGRIRGVKITRQGCATYFPHFNALSQGGNDGLVVTEGEPERRPDIPLDYQAIIERFVSITPLQRDQTDYGMVVSLVKEAPRLFPARRLAGLRLIGSGN